MPDVRPTTHRPRDESVSALRWRSWRLRTKIGVLVVVAAALPLLVAQALTYQRAWDVTQERTTTLLAARAEHLVADLDSFNLVYSATARLAARLPETVRILENPAQPGQDNLRDYLEGWPHTDDAILAVHVVDARGRILVSSEPRFEGIDISFRRFFQIAMGGIPVISDPFLAVPRAGSLGVVAYAAPVFLPGGRTGGVAIVLVRALALWDAVRTGNETAGTGSYSALCDRAGIRLAHSLRNDFVFHPAGTLEPSVVDGLERERRFGSQTRALLEAPVEEPESDARGDGARLPLGRRRSASSPRCKPR